MRVLSSTAARGFSFIELLVAVLVIVLLTGVVTLNVGRGGADVQLRQEVEYLASLFSYARDEAGFTSSDYGLFIGLESRDNSERYVGLWLRRFDQGWAAPMAAGEAFSPISFAENTELYLQLDGQPDVAIAFYDPELNPSPQVVFWAGGEVTPGSLDWHDANSGSLLYRMEWDLLGRLTLLPQGISDED